MKSDTLGDTRLVKPNAAVEKKLGVGVCLTGEYKDKTVYFKRYAGDEIDRDGRMFLVVEEEELLAVVS